MHFIFVIILSIHFYSDHPCSYCNLFCNLSFLDFIIINTIMVSHDIFLCLRPTVVMLV